MIFIFYFFAVVLIFFSYRSWRGGIEYLNFFKQELTKPLSNWTPFVSIIAPCRGLDQDLEKNLQALFEQQFPHYEIIFAVDSETDEALPIIQNVINNQKQGVKTKVIFAGKAENESQKVHNLREAVLHVADSSEIFVFVDSDARPTENWLRNLIAPLQDENIGCSTGYRWFISTKRSFGSELRSVWNASIASALGANPANNFCWGGSMAIRRKIFEKIGMREKWCGTLSDDFAVTRAMKKNDLSIFFVPQALTASLENCSLTECVEFTTRQMKITRVYADKLWKLSFIGAGLFNLVYIWGIIILFFYPKSSPAFWFSVITLTAVTVLSIGKSRLRLNAVKLVLTKYEKQLKKQFITQNTLWILTPALFFYNCCSALISRRIVWRGITYNLISANETKVIE